MHSYRYLVVGGGMTGDAVCNGIRDVDPDGSIGLIGEEESPPYKRPPLTKGLWKGGDESKIWRNVAEHCLGCRSHAIRPPDTRFDFRFDCHHRFDRPAGGNADVIDRIDIERVGHRDDQVVAVQHQRQHPALAG